VRFSAGGRGWRCRRSATGFLKNVESEYESSVGAFSKNNFSKGSIPAAGEGIPKSSIIESKGKLFGEVGGELRLYSNFGGKRKSKGQGLSQKGVTRSSSWVSESVTEGSKIMGAP